MKQNVFAYLDWRGDLTFQQAPFNEADALILSIISYLNLKCSSGNKIDFFVDAAERFCQMPEEEKYGGPGCLREPSQILLKQMTQTRRFSDMGVCQYVHLTDEKIEMQFSAVTFVLSDGTAFLAFRGTDNTLVGWKEDFNMAFMDGVPAQLAAAEYANDTMSRFPFPVRIGGHSKGGNLAIWAGAHLEDEYKERLLDIYSNDGPGFSRAFMESQEYQSVRDRIHSFVPDESIVGVLMEHDDYITIASSNPSIMQHDPFSWMIQGSHFVYKEDREKSVRYFERVINEWLKSMSLEEREELVANVYDIIASSNAKTTDDLDRQKIQALISMQKTLFHMDGEKKKQLKECLGKLFFHNEHLLEL